MKFIYLLFIVFLSIASCTTSDKKKEDQTNKQETVKEEPKVTVPKNQKLTPEQQLVSAVMAAPKEVRDEATVYGFDEEGNLITLRVGTNNFICIADNPSTEGFQVVCYHNSLEPMMARGRELEAEGKSRGEKEKIRAEEARSGGFKLPDSPAALHVYYGENGYFNTATNQIENAIYRYVIYVPYATQKTTGLPLKPNESTHPWLMFPGKYNAHIMITPSE
jgi:hypothetical protein